MAVKIRLRRIGRKKPPIVSASSSPTRGARATAGSSRSSASTIRVRARRRVNLEDRARQLLARRRRAADATPCARCSARPGVLKARHESAPRRASCKPRAVPVARSAAADATPRRRRAHVDADDARRSHRSSGGSARRTAFAASSSSKPITDAPDAVFAPGRRVFAGTASGDPAPERAGAARRERRPFKGGCIVALRGDPRPQRRPRRGASATCSRPRTSSRRSAKARSTCTSCSGMRVVLAVGRARRRRSTRPTSCRRASRSTCSATERAAC